jgi:hypothetical protein
MGPFFWSAGSYDDHDQHSEAISKSQGPCGLSRIVSVSLPALRHHNDYLVYTFSYRPPKANICIMCLLVNVAHRLQNS